MMKKRIGINIRLNPEDEADSRAWAHLQRLDKKVYKSYSRAIVMAINDFFDRQEQLATDPYLETREKEDAFLQNVLATITKGMQEAACSGTVEGARQTPQRKMSSTTVPSPTNVATRDGIAQAALDFLSSF